LTTQARAQESEQHAAQQADQVARLRDELLVVVSHELRAPLQPLLLWVDALLRLRTSSAEREKALLAIAKGAREEARLLGEILDASRLLSGKQVMRPRRLQLPGLLNQVMRSHALAIRAKGIQVVSLIETALPPILGDRNRLRKGFGQILSNAIKFTPRGGTISLSASTHEGQVRVEVRDNGVGIRPDMLAHVFEPFRQGEHPQSVHRPPGLGLGLSIVKLIFEAHGGSVEVHSDGPGHGTCVTVTLPLPPQPTAPTS
jgi:signal transduction histidine kinase